MYVTDIPNSMSSIASTVNNPTPPLSSPSTNSTANTSTTPISSSPPPCT